MADAASELRVFKDFFVEPNLPYSIVRGEVATVMVGVYNYLDMATTATVTLQVAGGVLEVRFHPPFFCFLVRMLDLDIKSEKADSNALLTPRHSIHR